MTKKRSLFSDFTTLALVLIPVGIAINYVGGLLVKLLQLPIFLDAIGTVVVSIVAGPWVGAVTGALYNFIFGLTVDPVYIPYSIVSISFGLVAGFMASRAGWFEKFWKAIIVGLALVAAALITTTPLDVILFGGAAQGASGVVTGYLIAMGKTLWEAVFAVSIVRELVDKILTAVVAYFIYKALPERFVSRFPGGAFAYLKKPAAE